jgi:Carboxypeptidase regulatory-like domain/FG-GAP-like repeat/BNR repeat-like domain
MNRVQSTTKHVMRSVLLTNRGGRLVVFLILAILATTITAISISSAQTEKRTEPVKRTLVRSNLPIARLLSRDFGASTANSQVFAQQPVQPGQGQKIQSPMLTLQTAPSIQQCRAITLNQAMIDRVNAATEDPAVTFERHRREHPHMIEMPPTIECESGLWRAARRGGAAEPSVDPDIINQRQFSLESVFLPSPLAAAVGTNIDPSNGVEGYQGENSIAVDPNNSQHLIAHSNTFFRDTTPQCQSPTGGTASTFGTMALFGSSDGGATWTYKCAPWHTSVTGGIAGANAWFGSDPALAWDNSGKAYACYMLLSEDASGNAGAAIVLARSTDNGQTWAQFGNPVVNRITSTTNLDDKEMFAIDTTSGQAHSFPGRFYVIWDEGNAERIAHSDDGVTWSTVTPSSNTGAIGGNLAIAPDGTVYVVWTRYNVETIVFSKSTDGGVTFSAPVVIATNALQSFGANNLPPAQDTRGINGFPSIDVDRNPASAFFGNIYVAYNDFPTGTTTGADLNAYMIRSTNGGTSWSTRLKVNDDNFGASQFFPWLAVDQSDGSVNMSWIDSRIDPINRKTQSVYARSIDGGVSFEPNILVTDNGANFRNNVNYADENTTDNPSFNGNQYGDYSGIAAFNRQVHPLWTDSRMFFPTADTQSPTRREDNATAVITNCSAPTTIAAPSVNSSTTPSVTVSWGAPTGWGTNATNGTYSVYRNTTSTFPGGSPLASGLTATNYVDTTGVLNTTYFYFVRAKNNCPGTALTPMTTDSTASASVVYGSSGTPTGVLQGIVTSGGSPVSGIVVSAGAYSASTNGSGFYQFPAINAGTYTVSASPAGYNPVSVNGVVVNGGATTVQDLYLTASGSNNCFTDTSFGDFSKGSGTNADIAASPGDVKLANSGGEAIDQNQTGATTISTTPTSTTWAGQTFTAGKTGTLTKISLGLGLNSGSTGTVTVEIHNASSNLPGSTVLSSVATLGPVTNATGTVATYTATFSSPASVVSGTQYSIVIKGGTGSVYVVRSSGNPYSGGQYSSTTNSGGTWTGVSTADMTFTTYVTTPVTYQTPGNFISSVKDSGAVTGSTINWTTIGWNNTALPAGTTLQFQAAASNNSSGPFNFVGPDGTSGTFFSNGGSLSQFNGLRYLKYKALLSTSNTANTPTVNDVTVCYNVTAPATVFSIGGQVIDLLSGNPISGVMMTLSGSQSANTSTDGSGNYSFAGLAAGGNYTVTPAKANYAFNPASRTYNSLATNQPSTNFVGRVVHKPSDFDADGKSDVAIWQGATSTAWVQLDSNGNQQTIAYWGSSALGDIPVPGDYDGDGKTDPAVWRPSDGNWYIVNSSGGLTTRSWGGSGDVPVAGDYDADGKSDFAVFRPSEGNWYIAKSGGGVQVTGWGAATDKPVPGDYDNDGRTDVAVFRPSEGNWYIIKSSTGGLIQTSFGASSDRLVPADYDGDGATDIAVFRPSEGNWYILNSGSGTMTVRNWGASTDTLVPADYDGDGKADIAVWRPSEGTWYIIRSSDGTLSMKTLGNSNDTPVPRSYLPQ